MTSSRRGVRGARALVGAILLIASMSGVVGHPAGAGPAATSHSRVVSTVPAASTPHVKNGAVKAIVQIGNTMVAGGTFTTVVSPGSSQTLTRSRLMAFDATSGLVRANFHPTVDGEVETLAAGPNGTSVFVGGQFTKVNGVASRGLARLDLGTGTTVAGFRVPALNGDVNDLRLVGSRLYLAGTFTTVAATPHAGLSTLNATTGAVDPFLNLHVSGHHNYNQGGGSPVGVTKFDITPDGARMIAVGNFTRVSGNARDQIVMISLTGPSATVTSAWATLAYKPSCFPSTLDSYMRGIQFSPDGSYFVVVTTGSYSAGSFAACSAAARFETTHTGADVRATWISHTGGNSLYSVAVTGAAVYVGGHPRWLNNPYGQDHAGPGAVPRAGIAALDPSNGVPLAWNPGRHPRGHGAEALVATASGLWVGSDTSYIGNNKYYRDRIAFFPLAGGRAVPPANTGSLPGTVYVAGRLSGSRLDDISTRDLRRRIRGGHEPGGRRNRHRLEPGPGRSDDQRDPLPRLVRRPSLHAHVRRPHLRSGESARPLQRPDLEQCPDRLGSDLPRSPIRLLRAGSERDRDVLLRRTALLHASGKAVALLPTVQPRQRHRRRPGKSG